MFQTGGVGPMFGQLGYFCVFAGKEIEDPRPRERYINEAKRLLAVIDAALAEWLVGALAPRLADPIKRGVALRLPLI